MANLLGNSGFESGVLTPHTVSSTNNSSITVESSAARTGSYGIKWNPNLSLGHFNAVWTFKKDGQTTTYTPSQYAVHTFSLWLKTNLVQGAHTAVLTIRAYTTMNELIHTQTQTFTSPATTTWQNLSIVQQPQAGTAYVQATLEINLTDDLNNASFMIDDVALDSVPQTYVQPQLSVSGNTNLRLEVEVPTADLPNLVQNSSGDDGAWGWLSPVTQTYIKSEGGYADGNRLVFVNATDTSVPANFTTEYLPMVPGKYVRAQFTPRLFGTNVSIKARFEFFDSSKVLLSSGTQTGLIGSSAVNTAFYMAATVAPANTAYARLRFDMYNNTGGNPPVSQFFHINRVHVAYTDTSTTVASLVRNLVPNPSFEVDTASWVSVDGTFNRTAAAAYVGTNGLRSNGTFRTLHATSGMPVTAGKSYSVSFYTRVTSLTTGRLTSVTVNWYKSNGDLISSQQGPRDRVDTAWYRYNLSVTAPSRAAFLRIDLTTNTTSDFDAFMVTEGTTLHDYFDGATPDTTTYDYGWSGTAHNSPSTRTTLGEAFNFAESNDWRDILGPTSEISIKRAALDVGTMSAVITDALLDPAVTSDIRPGKKVRVRTLIDNIWESIYEGVLTAANTSYDKPKTAGAEVKTRIEVQASDAISVLANQGETRGVATIATLPFILEGKMVPWNVNGSGNQVANATVAWINENASVLDQIALTRDSALGYAWVDRNGVLQVWNNTSMPTSSVATFSDVASADPTWLSYTAIDANFSTETCINEVGVKWLRYKPSKNTTEEITYGPYKDVASIATWGNHRADFTIGGASESLGNIQAFASAILTANSTPVIRCNSLTMPVRNDYERKWATMLDLYTKVSVKYDTKIDTNLRITSIEHIITPDKWQVNYGFDVVGSVAAPTWTPSPNAAGNTSSAVQFNDIQVGDAGTAMKVLAMGSGSANTNGSGECTLTHSLGITGSQVVMVQSRNNGVLRALTVTVKGTNSFTFRVNNDDGTIPNSGVTIQFDYIVVGV